MTAPDPARTFRNKLTFDSRVPIKPGDLLHMPVQLTDRFRPAFLIAHPECLQGFEVSDLRVGTWSLIPGPDLPIRALDPATGGYGLEERRTIEPGQSITLSVRNVSQKPQPFQADLLGESESGHDPERVILLYADGERQTVILPKIPGVKRILVGHLVFEEASDTVAIGSWAGVVAVDGQAGIPARFFKEAGAAFIVPRWLARPIKEALPGLEIGQPASKAFSANGASPEPELPPVYGPGY
jgi:hypothetical protein